MKYCIRILFVMALLGTVSCSEDELRKDDTLQRMDAVESVNDPYLLASIIMKTSLFYEKQAFDNRRLPGATQHMESNYQSSDNYYNGFKSNLDDMYTAMDILKLIDSSMGLSEGRGSVTHVGIFQVFRVMLFSFMTDFYGDVYYSEALKAREGILYPTYDNQDDIYAGLLSELDEAIAKIGQGTEEISSSYDLMYGGDKAKWLKFANSVKLRLLMRVSAKTPDVASKIAALANSVMVDGADNAAIAYVGTTKDNSWTGGVNNWGTIENFDTRRPSKTLVDKLADLKDPRMMAWFAPVEQPWTSDKSLNGVSFSTTDLNGYTYTSTWEYIDRSKPEIANVATSDILIDSNKVYVGFIAGMQSDWKNGNGHYNTADGGVVGNFKVSKFSKLFRENSHKLLKAMIMNSDEVQFLLAEAVAKGYMTGSADTYYKKGITQSMLRWGVPQASIDTYLAQASVALPSGATGQLAKIAEQKWIGLFLVSTEGYLDLRRTRLPDIFNNGRLSGYEFPLRYRYPGNESGQNRTAYDLGVQTLSPAVDDQFSKIWLLQ